MKNLVLRRIAGICPRCNHKNHPLAPDDQRGSLCDDCLQEILKTSCMIVCATCGEISAFVAPGISPDGFEFKLGTIYHSNHCPKCAPLAGNIDIVEVQEFLNERKVITNG